MKTVKERSEELAQGRKERSAANQKYTTEKLKKIIAANIPPKDEPARKKLRTQMAEHPDDGRWSNLACDLCKTEMWVLPGMTLSSPPQQSLGCPGCGASNTVPT